MVTNNMIIFELNYIKQAMILLDLSSYGIIHIELN